MQVISFRDVDATVFAGMTVFVIVFIWRYFTFAAPKPVPQMTQQQFEDETDAVGVLRNAIWQCIQIDGKLKDSNDDAVAIPLLLQNIMAKEKLVRTLAALKED